MGADPRWPITVVLTVDEVNHLLAILAAEPTTESGIDQAKALSSKLRRAVSNAR